MLLTYIFSMIANNFERSFELNEENLLLCFSEDGNNLFPDIVMA